MVGRQNVIRDVLNLVFIGLAALGTLTGCGGGGERYQYQDRNSGIRISLRLPPGWTQEGAAEAGLFSLKEDANQRGGVMVLRSEGKDLNTWVETHHIAEAKKMAMGGEMLGKAWEETWGRAGVAPEMAEETRGFFAWKLISKTPRKLKDLEAIELVEDRGPKRDINLFVLKGNWVGWVRFYSTPDQWAKNEPLFQAALKTVRIR